MPRVCRRGRRRAVDDATLRYATSNLVSYVEARDERVDKRAKRGGFCTSTTNVMKDSTERRCCYQVSERLSIVHVLGLGPLTWTTVRHKSLTAMTQPCYLCNKIYRLYKLALGCWPSFDTKDHHNEVEKNAYSSHGYGFHCGSLA